MRKTEKKKIIYVVTEDWYFWSHRLLLAKAALAAGYEVGVVTRVQNYGERILREGFTLIPINIRRRSLNPWHEVKAIRRLTQIYRAECPTLVHHVAIKPVIYGSIAARLARVPAVINALAGLGFVFSSKHWVAQILKPFVGFAYRSILTRPNVHTIVQNRDDLETLSNLGVVDLANVKVIRGSGVDTSMFSPEPERPGVPVVILPARMLRDKGVDDFVAAAQILRRQNVSARFVLVGDPDSENPTSVSREELRRWQISGVVEWWGQRSDMPEVFAQSRVVVLPSYREGLPKVLLEAAASGRVIVASDVPGCREVVRHRESGLLVPPRNPTELARAIHEVLADTVLRRKMTTRARQIVESEFRIEKVIDATLAMYRSVIT